MSIRIGFLLPRSNEYSSMGFDLLDGLRIHLRQLGLEDAKVITSNIGQGDDPLVTYTAAEKLILEDDVQLILAYATSLNAELLYSLADNSGKPFLFLDPGMEFHEALPNPLCRYISLQGLIACYELGKQAGSGQQKVIASSSFLDGGYRGSLALYNGLISVGGSISGNHVTQFSEADFTLEPLGQLIETTDSDSITASFSSYYCGFFMKHLQGSDEKLRSLPFYCTPFMADEQLLPAIPFPGGTFHTIVPWATSLNNPANKLFLEAINQEKNKTANIFHLLGWEAATVVQKIISDGISSVDDWTFESPRGLVQFHPETNVTFAPLYIGQIEAGTTGECTLVIKETMPITPEQHRQLFFSKPEEGYSRWKNNFLCI
jgi:branched-chain amino acid transport system substrate-binding protein